LNKNLLFSLVALLITVTSFSQTLDASNAPANSGGGVFAATTTQNVGQSFLAGLTGPLSQVNVSFYNYQFTAGDFRLTIYSGDGYGGSVLGTQNFTIATAPAEGEYIIPISSTINITAGNMYTMRLDGITGSCGFFALASSVGQGPYANGILYYGNGTSYSAYDLWFKTFVTTPTPATHLNFDGVNDKVDLGNTLTGFFTGRTAVSIEAWVRPETNTGLGVIVGNYNYPTNTGQMQMLLRRENNNYVFFIDGGSGYSSVTATSTVVLNTWQHVAGTWDGTTMRIYVDGVLVNSVAKSGSFPAQPTSFVLGFNSINEKFKGSIDEVRIWSNSRTIEQINGSKNCELQGSETGLVAYYRFNQGIAASTNTTETTLTNAVSGGANGTLTNMALTGTTSNWLAGSPVTTGSIVPSSATVTTPLVYNQGATASALTATTGTNGSGFLWHTASTGGTGSTTAPTPSTATPGNTSYWVSSTNANGCESTRTEIVVTINAPATHLNFDGVNDLVNIGNGISTNLIGSSFMTVEAWIRIPNTTGTKTIVSNHNGGGSTQFSLRVIDGTINGFLGFGTYVLNSPAASITANTWHHVAMVYNDVTLKLYINGVEVASTAIPSAYSIISSTQSYWIGRSGYAGEEFSGDIDEVSIWNKALTASDITNTMNCELQSGETGLLSYFKFNQGIGSQTNTTETSLTNSVATGANGTLVNFALTGTTSNFLSGSPVITGSIVPSSATVTTPVVYNQGATASTLTATTGTNGSGLLWYTAVTGGTGSSTAFTPSTVNPGNTSYWVSSTNANGCESARAEIVVTINASTTSGCWAKIEAGDYHTLAIAQNGTLWSWGINVDGQLGLGDNTDRNTPTQVGTATNWQSISCGSYHTLGIKTDGTLWSWGHNGSGQLGLGDNTVRNTPTQVGTATNWQSISCGGYHTLGIKTDGTLWSWGYNAYGQLGLGDNTYRNTPTQLGNVTNWQSISCGAYHTLGIKTDGTLWSWGSNIYGQLGLGNATDTNTPIQVGTATNWQSVSCEAQAHTLGIKTDGTLWSWGYNYSGQLGLGDNTDRNTPTQVGASTNWQSVSCGLYYTLGIKTDSTLWSWGDNGSGQLGLGDNTNRNTPTQLGNVTNWQSISCGAYHTLGIKTDGALWSWGYNYSGALGLGDNTSRNTPIQVACPSVLDNESFEVANKIIIYPNPSNGNFTIVSEEDSAVEVYDMIGKKVFSKNVSIGSSNLDLSNYANGIYLLTVTNQNGSLNTYKIVKQ
jgi:alpha-tubulin suppressor-like RCC1 family protein